MLNKYNPCSRPSAIINLENFLLHKLKKSYNCFYEKEFIYINQYLRNPLLLSISPVQYIGSYPAEPGYLAHPHIC